MENNLITGINKEGASIIKFSPNGDSTWCVRISDSSYYYEIKNLITDSHSNIYATYSKIDYSVGDVPDIEINLLKIEKSGQFYNGIKV